MFSPTGKEEEAGGPFQHRGVDYKPPPPLRAPNSCRFLPGSCETCGVAMVHGSDMLAALWYRSPERAVAGSSPVPFKSFSRGSLLGEEPGRDMNLGFRPND